MSLLESAIAWIEVRNHILVPFINERGEEDGATIPSAEVTLRELRRAFDNRKHTFKMRGGVPAENVGLRKNTKNLTEEIACFATVIAAAEIFLVDENDPVLDAVRNSLP